MIFDACEFFGPQMALAYRIDAISQGQKNSQFQGPNPLPLALVMNGARIKSIMQGGRIKQYALFHVPSSIPPQGSLFS